MVNKRELNKGVSREFEHTDKRAVAKKIALDHLKEDPRYYSKLDRMMSRKKCVNKGSGYLKGSKGLLSNPKGLLGNRY